VKSGHEEKRIKQAWGRGIAWSPDGQTLASCTCHVGGKVLLWNLDDGGNRSFACIQKDCAVTSVAFTADQEKLLYTFGEAGRDQGGAVLLDLKTGKASKRLIPGNQDATTAVLSPDGTLVALATRREHRIFIARTSGERREQCLGGEASRTWQARWGSAGSVVSWSPYRDLKKGEKTLAFDLSRLEFVPPDEAIAAYDDVAEHRLGDVELKNIGGRRLDILRHGEEVAKIRTPPGPKPRSLCFSVVSRDRAVVARDRELELYDLATGKRVQRYEANLGDTTAVVRHPQGRYILTTSEDERLRIFEWENNPRPLLTLFSLGEDWIAWTPEGYYACSPGGERLMGWQVNRGLDQLATYYPAAQFRNSLYRPDVIQKLLEAGSVQRARALADQARGEKSRAVSIADVLPPLVVITTPDQPHSEVREPQVPLRFVAKPVGGHPITNVRLLLDGRPYPATEHVKKFDPPRDGEVRETWSVKLDPGPHTLAVQAESAVSKAVSEPVHVTFGARGLVRGASAAAATPPQALPSLYVLTVGVSDYPEPLKLSYAAKDAQAIAHACQAGSPPLYRKVEVKTLTDAEATRRGILSGLTWLRKEMTQNDVAVVSFAGHGSKDADGRFYLLPMDVDQNDLLATAVSGEEFKRTLEATPGRFVLLLDACHSGAVEGEKRRAAGSLTDDLVRDLATDDYGVIVMCSAMGREFALESPQVAHGYFTLALTEGLGGKADYNQDSVIHFNELDMYVTDRVKELSQGKQHPVTARPTSIRSFPLTKP
jgi:hypothetical protein